jgi:cell division transport system ATP-binding protein
MISFKNVTKIYYSSANSSPIIALKNISFLIQPREFVSIVGRSGAGKTTLIKLLIGEEKLTEGEIFLKNKNIAGIKSNELQKIRKRIGVVYQDYRLIFSKTVYENVSYILEVMGFSDEDIARDIHRILEIVGLQERVKNFPKELSGGEQQRLVIARALVHHPEIVIADEPTGNLDPYNTFEVINLFKRINESGTTVILATHDKRIIDGLAKRVITLEAGRLIRDEQYGKFIL